MKKQLRPKYSAFVASSIDGKISLGSKTLPNWTSKEDWRFFQSSLARFDAVVVGRNTYETAAASLRKRNTYVLTGRVKKIKRLGTVTFVNPRYAPLAELLRDHKRVAVIGGGPVYQTMLDKDLLQEIYLTVEPLVFGRGKDMFVGGKKTAGLRLLSMKKLNSAGTVLLHYEVKKQTSR